MRKTLIAFLLAMSASLAFSACGFLPGGENSSNGNIESSITQSSSEQQDVTCTITFKQSGEANVVKTVKQGEDLTDIPTPKAKTGYTVTWDEDKLALLNNVSGNIEVTAKEEAKTYTITLDVSGGTLTQKTIVLKYGQEYELSTPSHNEKAFVNWTYNGQKVDLKGMWNIDEEDLTITLVALWGSIVWTDNY